MGLWDNVHDVQPCWQAQTGGIIVPDSVRCYCISCFVIYMSLASHSSTSRNLRRFTAFRASPGCIHHGHPPARTWEDSRLIAQHFSRASPSHLSTSQNLRRFTAYCPMLVTVRASLFAQHWQFSLRALNTVNTKYSWLLEGKHVHGYQVIHYIFTVLRSSVVWQVNMFAIMGILHSLTGNMLLYT